MIIRVWPGPHEGRSRVWVGWAEGVHEEGRERALLGGGCREAAERLVAEAAARFLAERGSSRMW